MRITNIAIENFMGITRAEFSLKDGALFLVGMNGAGKSSVQSAVQFALYGRCYDHTGRRVKNDDMLRRGETSGRVSLTIQPTKGNIIAFDVSLSRDKKGVVSTRRDANVPFALFVSEVGREHTMEIAEVCGNPKAFLHSDELRSLLSALCASEVTEDVLRSFCAEHWLWFVSKLKAWKLPMPASIPALDEIGKRAYDERRDVKAKLSEARAVRESTKDRSWVPVHPTTKQPLTVADLPKVESSLAESRKILDDYRAQLAVAKQTQSAPVDIDALRNKVKELEAQTSAAAVARASIESKRDELNDKISGLHQKSSDVRGRMALSRKTYAEGDECPECGQSISKAAAAKLASKQDAMKQELATCERQCEKAREELATLAPQVAAAQSAHQRLDYDLKSCRAEIEKAQREEKPARTATPGDLTEIIGKCEEKIKRGEECLAGLRRLQTMESMESGSGNVDDMESEVAMLDWAVAAFKDGEFAASTSKSGIADFEKRCDEFLKPRDYAIRFDVAGGEVYLVKNDAPIKIGCASKGEQALAQCAIAFAFNTNAPILLDDLDGLSFDNRNAVIARVKGADRPVIINAAFGLPGVPKVQEIAKALTPCTIAWVHGGTAKEIA